MAKLGGVINIEEQEKEFRTGFKVRPPGWYTGVIVKTELLPTSTGGTRLQVTFRTNAGDDIIESYNIVNNSDKAQGIARAAIAKIASSCGLSGQLDDTDMLHGKPLQFKVALEPFQSKDKSTGKLMYWTDGSETVKTDSPTQFKVMIPSNAIVDYAKVGVKMADNGVSAPSTGSGSAAKSSW